MLVAIVNSVVVNVHSLREITFGLSLHFNMDEQPGLGARFAPDFEELVGEPVAELGLAHDLLKLFVEALVTARPVDSGMDVRKAEGEERLEKMLERFLPRAVEIVAAAWLSR